MDLNDPRRRLQVLNSTNPSLRVSVAPQPTLRVAQPTPQPQSIAQPYTQPRLFVGNTEIPQTGPVQSATPEPTPLPQAPARPTKWWDKAGSFVFGNTAKLFNTTAAGITGAIGLADIAKESIFGTDESYKRKVNEAYNNLNFALDKNQNGGLFNQGTFFKNAQEAENISGGDLTKKIIGGGLGTAAEVVPFMRGAQLVETGGKLAMNGADDVARVVLPKFLPTAGRAALEGGAYSAAGDVGSQLADTGKVDGTQTALNALIGAGAGAGTFGLGRAVFKLRGGEEAAASRIISKMAKASNPGKIASMLTKAMPGLDKELVGETAKYIAQEDSKDAIEAILRSIEVDPSLNISGDVKQRLQDEGVTKVEKGDTPYGAEYAGNGVMRFKDADAASLDNIYHELGHHIYANKLTPEEKALFQNIKGQASQQAQGRKGYTPDDYASEDFSDFLRMAMTGKLKDVPEGVRNVVAKYAKVSTDLGDVVKSNADTVAKNFPDQVSEAYRKTGVQDSYNLILNALANTDKKTTVRDIVSQLVGNAEKTDINRLTRRLTDAKTPEDVRRIIDEESQLASGEAVRNEAGDIKPVENTPVTPEQVDQASALQTGTADPSLASNEAGSVATPTADIATTVNKNADAALKGQKVDDVFPGISDPEQRAAVQKLMDGLDEAQGAYNDKTKVVAKEKAQRIAAGKAAYEAAGGGEEGFRAKMAALKGKYSESSYQPISVDPKVEKTFLNAVEKSNLQDWEKRNTQDALRKVWGANPEKPRPSDIDYIRRFMNEQYGEGVGDEFAKGMEEALKQGTDFGEVVSNIAGLPRALMATGDLSGGFRQALPLGTRFPKIWANANVESVKYAFNPKYYEAEMKKIADAPDYNVISDKMGVDLTGVGAMQDEAFIGSGYAERIPIANIPIKAADRAYTGVLTRMRYDVASKLIKDAGGPEQFVKNMEEIYGNTIVKKGLFTGRTNKTDRAMRALGEVINTFTGRGGMKGGVLDTHMQTLSTLLFAPRLWAANLQRLNPAWYAKMARDNPQAAKLAMQSQGTFLTMAGTVLALAAAAGADVGTDPRSADFGKIKVGNTRYDILGGQQQNIVHLARQWTGQKVNSETGEVSELGEGFGAKTRLDLAADMFENKANPLLAFGMKLMQTADSDEGGVHRTDQFGKDFNVATEAAKLVTPLGIQGTVETAKDQGSIAKGVAMNAPSFFGVGVQTYGTTPSKDQTTAEDGTKKFTGKVTDDMVTDTNGNPILDDKGKPVKVKVPKDATELERQALIDDKRKSALADQFRRTLSKEDQALMKLNDKQLKQYVKDGKIDQTRMDTIKQYQKNAENVEGVDIPEGAKSQLARDFYLKYHSMDETRRKDWLKEEPDETAKTIAGLLNKERNEGLSEFKPSNALSKAYAEYENDLNTHPDYTEVDKRNKAKAFQVFAYKLNYNDNQKDIYNEGSSSDIRYLIDQKQVSKEDLDAAIKMDDELYNSGLVGSLKFSKRFRTEFGYGVPDGGGKNDNLQAKGSGSRRGRSGGKGDETPRTYINELLPGIKLANKGGDKPEFSTKRRTQGLSFKAPTPQKSGKKVSIRL